MKTIHLHYAHFNLAASTVQAFNRQKTPDDRYQAYPETERSDIPLGKRSIVQTDYWQDEPLAR